MRCKEAKRRMGAKAPDRELMEHIVSCPSCARHAEAAQVLERLLKDAGQDTPIVSFAAVRDRVNMIAKQQSTGEKIMSHLKDQFQMRPRLIAALGLVMTAFIFAVLVPFSSTQMVGWKVSLDDIDASAAPSKSLLNAAFTTAGLEDIYVLTVPGEDSTKDIVVETPSREEAREIARAIVATRTDSAIQLSIKPVVVTRSRTILARAYDLAVSDYVKARDGEVAPVRIMFDGESLRVNGRAIRDILTSPDLTDIQVKAEIEEILGATRGADDEPVIVNVETSADGKIRTVEFRADEAKLSDSSSGIKVMGAKNDLIVSEVNVISSVCCADISVPDSGMVIHLILKDKGGEDSVESGRIILKVKLEKEDD